MRVRELFNPMGVSQSFAGLTIFLDQDNCQVVNKTKQDNAILLHLRRESDGIQGNAYIRVQNDYAEIADRLLSWALQEPRIIGLTVNEVSQLETGLEVSSVNGRMQVTRSDARL